MQAGLGARGPSSLPWQVQPPPRRPHLLLSVPPRRHVHVRRRTTVHGVSSSERSERTAGPQDRGATAAASPWPPLRAALQGATRCCGALALALLALLPPLLAPARAEELPTATLLYNETVERRLERGRVARSNLPDAQEAAAELQYRREMFTDDGWAGLQQVFEYARYVETLEDAEGAPGCEECTANRLLLEKSWQVISNEFFDPAGAFTEAWWGAQLRATLAAHGGLLHSRRDAYAAASEMLALLGDRYTKFLTPSEFRAALRTPSKAERDYMAARAVGVGLELGERDERSGGWVVAGVDAESSGEDAGVRRGDVVLSIDSVPAAKLTRDQAYGLLRGPNGSTTALRVKRGGRQLAAVRTLRLEYRPLPQPPLKWARLPVGDGRTAAYLRLHYFGPATTRELAAAVSAAEADGVAGYVVDLRNNPGGVFEDAVSAATLFLRPGDVVARTVRYAEVVDSTFVAGQLPAQVFPTLPLGAAAGRPLVVLLNGSSASASEVLAGALRDSAHAVLVGERSFGKGVVQYFFPQVDGSGVKVTIAKYLSPSGYDVTRAGGLAPDLRCTATPRVDVQRQPDACVQMAVTAVGQPRAAMRW